MNPAIDKGHARDTMNWNGHGWQTRPRVRAGIIDFVFGIEAVYIAIAIPFTAHNMKTAIGNNTVVTATLGRHGCARTPCFGFGVVNFYNVGHFAGKAAAKATAKA